MTTGATETKKIELLKAPENKELGTGRRKNATARVQLFKGSGVIQVNHKDVAAEATQWLKDNGLL